MAGFSNQVCLAENIQTDANPLGTGSFTANGQLLIGGDAAPNMAVATLTAGNNISIANAQNSITITAASAHDQWTLIGASQTLSPDNGYICTSGGALALLLPPTSAVGDMINVILDGATSWQITQGAGQQVRYGNVETTAGAGGSITSTQQGDSLTIVCVTADTRWIVMSGLGNHNVV
jgi:hypothetical protein